MFDETVDTLTNMSAECDDPALMAALADEDSTALEVIYDRYGGIVYALAFRILHNRADAEEVTSEVFWELWNRRERYNPARGSPRSYILLLARSRAIDRVRDRPHATHVSLETANHDIQLSSNSSDALIAGMRPSEAEWNETRKKLQTAMNSLDSQQQLVLGLAFYGGLSHRQISDHLSSPLGTVKTNIRKGLIRLKQLLGTQE